MKKQKFLRKKFKTLSVRCFPIRYLVMLSLLFLTTLLNAQFECNTPDPSSAEGLPCFNFIGELPNGGCINFERFAPLIPEHTPIKTIRLVFHVFRRDDGTGNFQNTPTDIGYLEEIVETMNLQWGDLLPLNKPNPECPPEPIMDTRIRFNLQEIFFYNDSDAWCTPTRNNAGQSQWCSLFGIHVTQNNLLSQELKDNSLHVLIKGPVDCENNINTFENGGFSAGIPVVDEKFVVVGGVYNSGVTGNQPWSFSQVWPHGIPAVFTHEIGHALGLRHSDGFDFCCDTEEAECSSFMDLRCNPGGFDGSGFSECQIARMQYLLEDESHCGVNGGCSDISRFVITDYCTKDVNNPIIIHNGESIVWDVDKKLNSDVEIQTGGELIIRCTIGLPTLGTIRVRQGARLIVDGGTITHNRTLWDACGGGDPKNDKWSGIRIYGSPNVAHTNNMLDESYILTANDPGVVIIRDGATLEYAKNAISTAQYGSEGGIISANGSFFINNNRTAEIANYPFANLSSFVNCEFRNEDGYGSAGVTTWSTRGILFDNCLFQGFTDVGVSGWRARLTFTNCTFRGNHHGIRSTNTSPLFANFQIGTPDPDDANQFIGNHVGAFNMSSDRFFVQNNYFEDNLFGVAATGPSQFRIRFNEFNTLTPGNNIGIDLEQTTNLFNSSECNQFTGTLLAGIDASGDNRPFNFNNEDFQTLNDVIVAEINDGSGTPVAAGSIGDQGAFGNAVWNYFSNFFSNDFHINTIGSTAFFNYFFPQNPPDPRLEPECDINGGTGCFVTNNYEKFGAIGIEEECPPGIPPPGGLPCTEITKDCYHVVSDTVSHFENEIANGNDGSEMRNKLEFWHARKNYVFQELIQNWIDTDSYEKIDTLLVEENTTLAKRYRIGLKLFQEDFSTAQVLIQELPTETEDDQHFKAIQEINLEWQTTGPEFTLSTAQENTLDNIVASRTPSAGYAKSLLTVLNDDIFDPELPDLLEERSAESIVSGETHQVLSIKPNPASGFVNVSIPNHAEASVGTLRITDLNGKVIKELSVETGQEITISIADWKDGLYIASLRIDSAVTHYSKFVVKH